MKRVLIAACVLVVGFILTVCSMSRAQSASEFKGKVVDAGGAAIPNAAVSLTDLTTSKVVSTTTGPDGQFVFTGVSRDPQLVTVEKSGFETFSQRLQAGGSESAS